MLSVNLVALKWTWIGCYFLSLQVPDVNLVFLGECQVNPQSRKQRTIIETKTITIDLTSSDYDVTTKM
jgi:hypothetical protein